MRTCANCKEKNLEGSLFCSTCGRELDQTLEVHAVQRLKQTHQLPPPPDEPQLTLMIVTAQGVKPLTLPYGKSITLGRSDREGQVTPHIDLAQFGAAIFGVSRLHAIIDYTHEAATITDLDSTNGTYLNDKKLEPHQAHVLRYGDELRLGKLPIYIYTS